MKVDFRIGVLSDTHIPVRARHLPAEIFIAFTGVDLILHAGDIKEWSVIQELSTLAPVEAVFGNMD
ncbi:MAG: YfcE family phosphodiesterase, partial [Firmicutes bacterium]|nr:YfcE family phosphodiesterase [Bacillota bacterium]